MRKLQVDRSNRFGEIFLTFMVGVARKMRLKFWGVDYTNLKKSYKYAYIFETVFRIDFREYSKLTLSRKFLYSFLRNYEFTFVKANL